MDIRFDRGVLRRPTRKDGALVLEGHAARVHRPGDPLRYPHGNEYRDDGELRALIGQLKGIPVTLGHPPGLISQGASARVVGRVDAAWLDGEHAAVRVTITDPDAIDEIMAGTKELSLGYATRVDGAGYQRDSEADHLAVIERARCGTTCALRTDEKTESACECSAEIDRPGGRVESGSMKTLEEAKVRIDELTGETKAQAARIVQLEADLVAGAQAAESEKLKAEKLRADEAEAKVAKFDETFEVAVRARAKLEHNAARIMGTEFRMDGMSERGIHEAVVKRLDASVDVKGISDAELRGTFNTLIGQSARNVESQARVSEVLGRVNGAERKDAAPSHEDVENNRWKKTLSKGRDAAAEGR